MNAQNGNASESGLCRYLQLIGKLLDADMESARYEWQPEITAYLPLGRLAGSRGSGTPALWWGERAGWALVVDTDDDFEVIARHVETVLPPPRVVAVFARDVLDGTWHDFGSPSTAERPPMARTEVLRELAAYAPPLDDPPQGNGGPHPIWTSKS